MTCPKCGFTLPDDSEFCQYCGCKLSVEDEKSTTSDIQITDAASTADIQQPSPECEEASDAEAVSPQQESASDSREDVLQNHNTEPSSDDKGLTQINKEVPTDSKKKRFCKFCGGLIDSETKKCTSCGKQYFKITRKPVLLSAIVILGLVIIYFALNYFGGINAMNEQRFIEAQQHFDHLPSSELLFSEKTSYIDAGVLMEEGKYLEALNAFNSLEKTPVPVAITDELKSKVYAMGQEKYHEGAFAEAEKYFSALGNYKRSDDYHLLIYICSGSDYTSKTKAIKNSYPVLIKLLGFENTNEIILEYEFAAQMFLEGRWEDGNSYPLYFEMKEDADGSLACTYNLPRKNSTGYYSISEGVYSVGETTETEVKDFKFTIIDEDTISAYCYKDGSTHILYRQ